MKDVRYEPFIGKDYKNQDLKILVLGESHYLDETQFSDLEIKETTKRVVGNFLKYKKGELKKEDYDSYFRTYTTFSNVFHNDSELSNEKTIAFWETFCFYNYSQFPTSGPEESPTKEDFENSYSAFKSVIEELKPDMVIFWSKRLWENFPTNNEKTEHFNGKQIHILDLDYPLPIFYVNHPSRLSYDFYPKIQDDMKLIKSYLKK